MGLFAIKAMAPQSTWSLCADMAPARFIGAVFAGWYEGRIELSQKVSFNVRTMVGLDQAVWQKIAQREKGGVNKEDHHSKRSFENTPMP